LLEAHGDPRHLVEAGFEGFHKLVVDEGAIVGRGRGTGIRTGRDGRRPRA